MESSSSLLKSSVEMKNKYVSFVKKKSKNQGTDSLFTSLPSVQKNMHKVKVATLIFRITFSYSLKSQFVFFVGLHDKINNNRNNNI